MYIAVKTNTAVFEGLVELGFEKTKEELKMTCTKNKIKLMREADLQSPLPDFRIRFPKFSTSSFVFLLPIRVS